MIRALAVALLLAGCSARCPVVMAPPDFDACPAAVAVPPTLPRIRDVEMIARQGTRLELAREAERRRGDACAEIVGKMAEWMRLP